MATIRADLIGVVIIPNDNGEPLTLKAGDTIPAGVTVGDHLTEAPKRKTR